MISTHNQKKGNMNLTKDAQSNPKMVEKTLGNAFDPRMLQQLGGMGNIMNMVKRKGKFGNNLKKWEQWRKTGNLVISPK